MAADWLVSYPTLLLLRIHVMEEALESMSKWLLIAMSSGFLGLSFKRRGKQKGMFNCLEKDCDLYIVKQIKHH